jgi:hypothetical protein
VVDGLILWVSVEIPVSVLVVHAHGHHVLISFELGIGLSQIKVFGVQSRGLEGNRLSWDGFTPHQTGRAEGVAVKSCGSGHEFVLNRG